MFLHCRYINTRAQASASWFDNAQEGKKKDNSPKTRTLAGSITIRYGKRTQVRFRVPPPILKVPTLISWDFFCPFPSENRNDVASVASEAARFSARFPQIHLSVISRDASARDPTSSLFNDLQAAGSISNLVGRWGIGNAWTVCLLLITWSRYR